MSCAGQLSCNFDPYSLRFCSFALILVSEKMFKIDRIRKSEFLKNVFTLVSVTSVAQGIAILIYPVLSRLYNPEDFGLFALYMSIVTITSMIATGKYELAVMIPSRDEDGYSLAGLSAILAVLFSICPVCRYTFPETGYCRLVRESAN